MTEVKLEKRYQAKDTEPSIYEHWESKGLFRPESDHTGTQAPGKPYVVVIPPPNVTGILHMGHALNNTIQDILIRWQRMKGKDTLWIPGTDHAGIATQNVVERKLAKEKKTRYELGREKFLEEIWTWKEEHGNTITRQLRRLGASCDWSRERFTMDEGLSASVREAFVTLHERGLIYRGNYIINWCPRCQTALSDEEAEHRDVTGGLYHIKYPVAGMGEKAETFGEDHIVVATTRPETMLGDTAVAVNPKDERYSHLIGKTLILPLLGREIPVIADEFVDPEFGTGMVKVTPAHDPNDFEMGLRHDLPQINVMHPDGMINENGGPYNGLERFVARNKVIKDLEAKGLFIKKDKHSHAVGHCYRCHTVVEPYLSKQWFVKMKPMAEKALKAHAEGKTRFYPDRWTKVYTNWLEGIRDWCISRQIWWGHQIPVWYDEEGNVFVARSQAEAEAQALEKHGKPVPLTQDPDVLDTWFSSWLWPFSTLGWPNSEDDLKKFYPTSDLITAAEIIFFWVARMIMAGLEFIGEVPFERIYIHGTVRAEGGLKMSKSLGNSIDPLEVIDEMGADALRYSLIMLSAQDVYLSREKFEVGRNFTNKIWNATRFAFMSLEDFCGGSLELDLDPRTLPLASRWILSKLERKTAEIDKNLNQFGLAQATTELYHFVWNDFCDWYIELTKTVLSEGNSDQKQATQRVLFYMLERIFRLLHPFMPFVTQELWSKLRETAADADPWPADLISAPWPLEEQARFHDPAAEIAVDALQDAVSGIRDLRARLNIPPQEKMDAVVYCQKPALRQVFDNCSQEIQRLARLGSLDIVGSFEKNKAYMGNSFPEFEVFLKVEGVVDPEKEKVRIEKKLAESRKYIESLAGKLANQNFVRNAPEEVVARERQKLEEARKVLQSYEEHRTLFS